MARAQETSGAAELCCPACSADLKETDAATINCRECGLSLSAADFDEVRQYAHTVATFGYLYPKVEAANGSDRRYSLLVDPTLVWLALAAASGIVGGLAYDVIKVSLMRLRKKTTIPVVAQGETRLSTRDITIGPHVVMSLELSEAGLTEFVTMIESWIAASRGELAEGQFAPPSGKQGYIEARLRAQATRGWQGPVLDDEDIAKEYERFRAYYAERRKRDLAVLERYENVFLEIAGRMKAHSTERATAPPNKRLHPTAAKKRKRPRVSRKR